MKRLLFLLLTSVALSTSAGEPRTATLEVKNMTCATCPLTVRQVLKRQAGVLEAKVDLKTESAQVMFDPAQGKPEQFARAVSEAGYPARVRP